MFRHLLSNMLLLGATLLLCSVAYPLALLGIGQGLFRQQAEGSLVYDRDGTLRGSQLIAQPFTADEYFWPRPSAASYNGAAAGASNWGASQYLLRDRVARALGPIVKYRDGKPVAPDVETWFQKDRSGGKPGIVAQWAEAHATLAQNWVKADKLNGAYVADWIEKHPEDVTKWKEENKDASDPKPEDLAVAFFAAYGKQFPGTFPSIVEEKADGKEPRKLVKPLPEGADIQSTFFDMWRQEHPDADLEPVPADLVMASGSGLDPHITLASALYQLDRVAAAWSEKTKSDKAKVKEAIGKLLREKTTYSLAPGFGPALVNVVEVNNELGLRLER